MIGQARHYQTGSSRNLFRHRSKAMSTHQDLKPESHGRTHKRISHDRLRRTFYIEDLARSYRRTCYEYPRRTSIQAPTQREHLQDLLQVPLDDVFSRIATRPSDKDLYQIMQGPLRQLTRISRRVTSSAQDHAKAFLRACH